MSGPATAVLGVLQEVLDLLTDPTSGCVLSPEPCKIGLVPGSAVAWDTCGEGKCATGKDGQLWANLNTFTTVGVGPCQTITWTATIGIVRCVATVKDDGTFPTSAELLADADQQAADADSIKAAIDCCENRSENIRDVTLVAWTALGPTGGCAGGQWTVKGVLDVCC